MSIRNLYAKYADGGAVKNEYRGPGLPDPAFGPGTGWRAGSGTVAAGIGNAGVYTGDKPVTRGPSGDYYDPLYPPSPNIKPLQIGETMQDYYNRLGQWEQTPEGQAVKAKQEADRWAVINRIRAGMASAPSNAPVAGPQVGPSGYAPAPTAPVRAAAPNAMRRLPRQFDPMRDVAGVETYAQGGAVQYDPARIDQLAATLREEIYG